MYFTESSALISARPLDRALLTVLDRELAHVFAVGGRGFIDLALLQHRAHATAVQLRPLLVELERRGVCTVYSQVKCQCDECYDPGEGKCTACGLAPTFALSTGLVCVRVIKQPSAPAYDPTTPPANPTVFVSYRHSDTSTLASDIYYSLGQLGHSIFLDQGDVPVGAPPEGVYLRAASIAKYFVSLVSTNYFDSPYCRKEIAHAARSGARIIRVNVPPFPAAPNDMIWIDAPNWNPQAGSPNGLDITLEQSLRAAVQTPASAANSDLRKDACGYLMEQLDPTGLLQLWNRLGFMMRVNPSDLMDENIRRILQATTPVRVQTLCTALAP